MAEDFFMAIPDKVAAANKINEFLTGVVTHGGLRLKYRITVDPPLPEERDWERPEILVDFAGPDSGLLLERGGELLRALEEEVATCCTTCSKRVRACSMSAKKRSSLVEKC